MLNPDSERRTLLQNTLLCTFDSTFVDHAVVHKRDNDIGIRVLRQVLSSGSVRVYFPYLNDWPASETRIGAAHVGVRWSRTFLSPPSL